MDKFKDLFSFKKKEVDLLFKKATKKASMPGFILLKAPIDKEIRGKFLIVIPKKFGKAHDRNLLRRQIKSIFYEEKLYQSDNIWILIAYKDAKKLSFQELKLFLVKNIKK